MIDYLAQWDFGIPFLAGLLSMFVALRTRSAILAFIGGFGLTLVLSLLLSILVGGIIDCFLPGLNGGFSAAISLGVEGLILGFPAGGVTGVACAAIVGIRKLGDGPKGVCGANDAKTQNAE
jgi:hypothetical protein